MTDYRSAKKYSEVFKKKIDRVLFSAQVARDVAADFKKTTRKRSFRSLKRSTIENRKKLEQYNQTHPEYASAKSNLTFTGQLIESVKSFIRREKGVIELIPTGKNKKYTVGKKTRINKSGERIVSDIKSKGKQSANIDIAKGQKNMGRDMFKLERSQKKSIIAVFANAIYEKFGIKVKLRI